MSLSRDVLLFSVVVMVWSVQIEARGYGSSESIVLAALAIGVIGLVGSIVSSLYAASQPPDSDPAK